jgi:site-specific DNA-cytosine methylase
MNKNVLGVCGGNGVILHPFKDNLIANLEPRAIFHTKGDKQWYSNFKAPIVKRIEDIGDCKVDIIIGAPDCGHSSILALSRAKKNTNPWDNDSVNLFFNSIIKFKPKVWVMENLPKFLESLDIEDFWYRYNLRYHVSSVTHYGNSQVDRIRLIVVGIRKDVVNEELINDLFPKENPNFKPKNTQVLLRGMKIENLYYGNVREDINDIITLYAGFKDNLKNIQNTWIENDWKRWKVENRNFTTAPGVYRNKFNEPPKTARKANRQFNPNGLMMTPRELARIQGVPDEFRVYMEKDNLYYWINKGRATVTKTPPYEIGVWFYNILKQHQLL